MRCNLNNEINEMQNPNSIIMMIDVLMCTALAQILKLQIQNLVMKTPGGRD